MSKRVLGNAAVIREILDKFDKRIPVAAGITTKPGASFIRPADTTAYVAGDLVANSTVAGAVLPLVFENVAREAGLGGMIRRCRIRKTGTATVGATFRVHLYCSAPTPAAGDNGAWLTNKAADYVGALDVTVDKVFSDGAAGNGVPAIGSEIVFKAVGGASLYGLVECRGPYAPANGETFTVELEVLQD